MSLVIAETGAWGVVSERACVDGDLERVVDAAAADRLMAGIATALGNSMVGRPEAVMRAWRVLLARMDGQTLDQIAAAEGRSRERIRQILREIARVATAEPNLFDGFGGLEHAARCAALGCRFASWSWRRGHTTEPPKSANLRRSVGGRHRAGSVRRRGRQGGGTRERAATEPESVTATTPADHTCRDDRTPR